MPRSILILGGTHEALKIAELLFAVGDFRVITSLAGRVKKPRTPAGELRLGGFGGVDGLAEYLRNEAIDLLIDATHPFAENISKNAVAACEQTNVERLHFLRPEWKAKPEDHWLSVPGLDKAVEALPENATVFLALGSQHLAPFSKRKDIRFIARMIEKPTSEFTNLEILIAKPSNILKAEIELLETNRITHIVCRNSGGTGAWQKLLAARKLQLPVIMIERPTPPAGKTFSSVDALIASITGS
ncbi:MAG: cobalt-precorrin-6A reductase [Hyphomicrobiales bacterium]|nr:MAG: cobalt-precorrin-6A reductase [Hyphomicrobiales bacterium]